MKFDTYLTMLARDDGSDLYLSTGAVPSARFHGQLTPFGDKAMQVGEIAEIANALMDEEQQREFDRELEMNLAYGISGVGRFRVNIFKQRNQVSIVARNIVTRIPSVDKLGLPDVLNDVIMTKRGLVLFVVATGSGKSTSLEDALKNADSANNLRLQIKLYSESERGADQPQAAAAERPQSSLSSLSLVMEAEAEDV